MSRPSKNGFENLSLYGVLHIQYRVGRSNLNTLILEDRHPLKSFIKLSFFNYLHRLLKGFLITTTGRHSFTFWLIFLSIPADPNTSNWSTDFLTQSLQIDVSINWKFFSLDNLVNWKYNIWNVMKNIYLIIILSSNDPYNSFHKKVIFLRITYKPSKN